MKICFVLGTRPEIIKTSPVIKQLQKEKINFFILPFILKFYPLC